MSALRLDALIAALVAARVTAGGDAVIVASTCCDSNVVHAVDHVAPGQVFLGATDGTLDQVSGEPRG